MYIYIPRYMHVLNCTCIYIHISIYTQRPHTMYIYVYIYIYTYVTSQVSARITPLWCARFKRTWKYQRSSATAKFSFDMPQIEAFHKKFKATVVAQDVHPRLILNYDQVWPAVALQSRKILKEEDTVGFDKHLYIYIYNKMQMFRE